MGMLNITSLPKHIDEIRVILADECLDILALNETRLDNTINNQVMCRSNYDLIIGSIVLEQGEASAYL